MPLFSRRTPGTDSADEQAKMVEEQLVARGIRDRRVLEAMRHIPRDVFVSADMRDKAYDDNALPIELGQTISQPYMVAIMTELIDAQPDHKVLEIGTGSGYQTAVLSCLCKELHSVERYEALAKQAQERLDSLGITNVHVHVCDGTKGYPDGEPYDRIIVTAAAPSVPEPLMEQLASGGRLVCPVGSRDQQELLVVRRSKTGIDTEQSIPCRFVPLVGEHAWRL